MKSDPKHWDAIFARTPTKNLGWYENDTSLSLQFFNQIRDWHNSTIFISGVGTSTLIEELTSKNPTLILNDISPEAINLVKERIGKNADQITWLCQDIASPLPTSLPPIDIWFDRAVLHFLNNTEDIIGYFNNIKSTVKLGGHIILAEFSTTGALKCAGLNVRRYAIEDFVSNLGSDFQLANHLETNFINPRGETRPYIYALFKRIN